MLLLVLLSTSTENWHWKSMWKQTNYKNRNTVKYVARKKSSHSSERDHQTSGSNRNLSQMCARFFLVDKIFSVRCFATVFVYKIFEALYFLCVYLFRLFYSTIDISIASFIYICRSTLLSRSKSWDMHIKYTLFSTIYRLAHCTHFAW